MAVDQVLVNAAFKLGESYNPGDYSKIYNKQYEGLIELNKQNALAWSKVAQSAEKAVGKIYKAKTKRAKKEDKINQGLITDVNKGITEINKLLPSLCKTQFEGVINENVDYYNDGGTLNQSIIDPAQVKFEDLYEELEAIKLKTWQTKEDRTRRTEIRKILTSAKKHLVDLRPEVTSVMNGVKEGHYNLDRSFKDDPILGVLASQWLEPSADHYKNFGITTSFNDNFEPIVTYDPAKVLRAQYLYNSKGKDEDMDIVNLLGELGVGSGEKSIKVQDLFGMLHKRDIKSANKINEVNADLITSWDETMSGTGRQRVYEYENFDKFEGTVYNNYESIIYDKDEDGHSMDIYDFATTDQKILGGTVNYLKDLTADVSFINNLKYEDIGLDSRLDGSDGSTPDGIIQPGEVIIQSDRNILIDALINPKTEDQRKIASQQLAWYLTQKTKQILEDRRIRQNPGSASGNKIDLNWKG